MTAPTPVSALLHAATLVTAGMFLLLRSGNVLANYFQLNHIIFSIGALTALIAGLTAVFQTDIKKLIAYSSQLSQWAGSNLNRIQLKTSEELQMFLS